MARVEVIDNLGLQPLTEDRYQRCATIVTSRLPVERWHCGSREPPIAYAIVGRLVTTSHRVELSDEALRRSESLDTVGETADVELQYLQTKD